MDRELWIASDHDEAVQLREELAAEGDDRPILLADDIVNLASLSTEGLAAAVRTIVAFPQARVVSAQRLPELPEGATEAVYFEFSRGTLIRERVFGATAAKPESAEPLVAATEPVEWSGDADELTAWFVRALAECHLPTEPFQLDTVRHVVNPDLWYRSLEQDIAAGPRAPQAGVLVEELRRLRAIVETNDNPA